MISKENSELQKLACNEKEKFLLYTGEGKQKKKDPWEILKKSIDWILSLINWVEKNNRLFWPIRKIE